MLNCALLSFLLRKVLDTSRFLVTLMTTDQIKMQFSVSVQTLPTNKWQTANRRYDSVSANCVHFYFNMTPNSKKQMLEECGWKGVFGSRRNCCWETGTAAWVGKRWSFLTEGEAGGGWSQESSCHLPQVTEAPWTLHLKSLLLIIIIMLLTLLSQLHQRIDKKFKSFLVLRYLFNPLMKLIK